MLVRENVQSYPRPPVVQPVAERLRVLLGGDVVVDTDRGLRVLETHHAPTYYMPIADISADLTPAAGSTFCEWKGRAHYWTVTAGGVSAVAAAWSYPNPTRGFQMLKDHVAIYSAQMEACFVGDERVTPQPGDFYGGWVTSNLDGIVKGDAATRHW